MIASPEAETQVLCVLLMQGAEALTTALEWKVDEAHFAEPQNKLVWKAILYLHRNSKPITIDVLAEELKTKGKLEEVGMAHLLALTAEAVRRAVGLVGGDDVPWHEPPIHAGDHHQAVFYFDVPADMAPEKSSTGANIIVLKGGYEKTFAWDLPTKVEEMYEPSHFGLGDSAVVKATAFQ